jgi:TRAP-type C4-dicarboxylate transport system permease small subunit
MRNVFKALLKGIELAEMNFCLIAMALTTLLICATVVNRYLLHIEIMWLNDAALYVFVFFMFVAFAVTAYREGHISIEMFKNRVFKNMPVGEAFYRVFLVVLSIVILAIFLPAAYQFMMRAIQYPEYGTLIRWFNTSWLQISLFITLLLTMLHLLVILVRDIRRFIEVRQTQSPRGRK